MFPSTSSDRKPVSPARFFFLGALLLFLLWGGLKSWRIFAAAQSLLDRQGEIEALTVGGVTRIDPEAAQALVLGVRDDIVALKSELEPFLPLSPYLGWLPRLGPTISAAPQLLEMADAGSAAAVFAFRGLKPALLVIQQGGGPAVSQSEQLVQILDAARPDLEQASLSLDRLVAAREVLGDTSDLPWRLRTLLDQADDWLPIGSDGLKLAMILPEMLGSHGPRSYLIIAQNEDELRPTGGFITGAGIAIVENGRIVDLTFQDANLVDNWRQKPYELPPQPLFDFMLLELFLFRDANFWPDFPTSAETALQLYSYGQDVPPPDGAIAVNQRFMELLLEGIGPVTIPDQGVIVDSSNIIDSLRAAWSPEEDQTVGEWIVNRKSFLAFFAVAIKEKIESDLASIDPLRLIQNLFQAASTKDLQIYLRDPEAASILAEINWDGRLQRQPDQDFLMVVDTNMGYNKANVYIERQIEYQVTLNEIGPSIADLTVLYRHTGTDTGEACSQGSPYDADPTYQEATNKCYWNYLRIYTPRGSQLIDSSRHLVGQDSLYTTETWDSTAVVVDELPALNTFANFLMLPRAQSMSSHYRYYLPAYIDQILAGEQKYQLEVYKQAGAPSDSVNVTIALPEGAQLDEATPQPASVNGREVKFSFELASDTQLTLVYHLAGTG